jgi:hypothetical protein
MFLDQLELHQRQRRPRTERSAVVLALLLGCFYGAQAGSEPARPFVLVNSQELATLREQLSRPGWKTELYRAAADGGSIMNSGRGIHANAELWLKRNIEIPAKGGHFHQFFCADGEQLELPTDQRFVPEPYRCPKCGRAYTGEKYQGALRRVVHGWLSQAALDLALVAALEQRPVYAAKAKEILLKYADAYPGPHEGSVRGGMILQSLDEAMWVIPLAQAYDLIHGQTSPDERKKIESFLRQVAYGLQVCGTGGNWGSWHLSAVGVVGYAVADEKLIEWATAQFHAQIRDQLGDDGLWPESVHTYHFFALIAFIHFAEAAQHAGVDLYRWEGKPGKSLLSMFNAPLNYAYPDLRLPAINDGWFNSFLPADCYEVAWYRTHDPRFGWVLANGYKPGIHPGGLAGTASKGNQRDGLYAFLFGTDLPAQVTPPAKKSVNFPVLGICALRSTNDAMLTFDYGPFLGHGHKAKMGLTLFANHKLWLADYGTPGYGSEIVQWYQSTFSHNTVVVDGKNQAPTKENQAQLWLNDPTVEAVVAETAEAYPGVVHQRTVIRARDYFVIKDDLSSSSEHVYDFYLHGEGTFSLDAPAEHPQAAAAPNRWIESLVGHSPRLQAAGSWSENGTGVAFWIRSSSEFTPLVGKCPAETGTRKIPLLIARQKGRTANFLTVLFPYSRSPKLEVQEADGKLTVRHEKVADIVTLPSSGYGPSLISGTSSH